MKKPSNNRRVFGRLACWGALVLTAVRLVSVGAGAVSAADAPPAQSTRAATPAAATCANSHCHGSNNPASEVWRRASTVWASDDPHAGAYLVLFQHESQRMVEKLSGGRALDADSDVYRRFVEDRCVACHASPSGTSGSASCARAGVTCGACHGEPSPWLDGHLIASANRPESLPDEFTKSIARPDESGSGDWTSSNRSYGLRALDDTVTRARVCVGCHVGAAASHDAPARDVNHDLIAAGHPRLAFEYTSHLANLAPHWRPSAAADPPPQDAAQKARHDWAVGQLVSADAAVELLLSRIDSGVLPEFSGYDCAACHHSLRGVDTRDDSVAASRVRRNAIHEWGGWYFAATAEATGGDAALAAAVASLRDEMARMTPDRERARSAALLVRAGLHRRLRELADGPIPDEFEEPPVEAAGGWDRLTQIYLMRFHLHASGAASDAGEEAALRRAYRALEPASNQNAPLWLHSGQPSSESNLPAASNGPAP